MPIKYACNMIEHNDSRDIVGHVDSAIVCIERMMVAMVNRSVDHHIAKTLSDVFRVEDEMICF